jgi:hypothetical protein
MQRRTTTAKRVEGLGTATDGAQVRISTEGGGYSGFEDELAREGGRRGVCQLQDQGPSRLA